MRLPRPWHAALVLLLLTSTLWGSAYNDRPKLIVVIVIDQFRGDYLERYRDQFGDGGFRMFLDRGAVFTDCKYNYANTRTAPGHATLFTGSYSNGHGIFANEWYDPQKKKRVSSVEDDTTKLLGITSTGPGASPRNLLSDTLGDELKLATGGKARVFGIAMKDRAAIFPAGHSGDGAYWTDGKSGAWITSTYYRQDLPEWIRNFNGNHRTDKYWNREWKDNDGTVLGSTVPRQNKNGTAASFSDVIRATPYANDYEFEFAKELVLYEKLGAGPATDLLAIGLSANDILGHHVGPDAREMHSMVLETDRQLAAFITFLGKQVGLANIWLALSADHGIAPLPDVAQGLRLPAANLNDTELHKKINDLLSRKYSKNADYIDLDFPVVELNEDAFAGRKEADAEADVGEAMRQAGFQGYFTKVQLARGETPDTEMGRQYAHSYSAYGGWYVMGIPGIFQVGYPKGTDHATPFSYDTHVPLAFYGLAFQPGLYRTHAEPVDLATTLSSLLGINPPTHAIGRVLTEALQPPRRPSTPAGEKQ